MNLNNNSLLYKINQTVQKTGWEKEIHSSQDYFKTTCISVLGLVAVSLLTIMILSLTIIGLIYTGLHGYCHEPMFQFIKIGDVNLLKELSSANIPVMISFVWSMGLKSIIILLAIGFSITLFLLLISSAVVAILLPTEFKETLKRIKSAIKKDYKDF